MLLEPKCLKLRSQNDLRMNNSFESLFLEISVANMKLIAGIIYIQSTKTFNFFFLELLFINYTSLATVLTPYSLQPCNQSMTTIQQFISILGYIITIDKHRTKICKTFLKTDRLATILLSDFKMKFKKLPTTKLLFDLKKIIGKNFCAILRALNWAYLYCLDDANQKFKYSTA